MVNFSKSVKDEIIIRRFISNKLISSMDAGVFLVDRDMRVVWVNSVMKRRFGRTKNICGRHCFTIYGQSKTICENCPTMKTFGTGDMSQHTIQVGKANGGRRGYYQLTTTPIRDGKGDVVYVLEMVQDLTDYVKTQKAQEAALKKKVLSRTKKLKDINEQFLSIFKIGQSLSLSLNMPTILNVIAKGACSITSSKACVIRLLDGDKKKLILKAGFGLSKTHMNIGSVRVGEGICGNIVKSLKPTIVKNIKQYDACVNKRMAEDQGFTTVLGVPVIYRDEPLGVIMVYGDSRHTYTQRDKNILSLFASQAAISIRNAELHESTHMNYLDTINSLILAMEAKDPYTRGHSDKVTRYALSIANKLDISEIDIQYIRLTGKLHDIGKIAIPDNILNKPGGLTPSERAVIELHPIKGAEILTPLKFLDGGISLVRHHHERYDGNGYPDSLRKENIPITARILAVADSFDAMTSDRPYRKGMAIEDAVNELKACSVGQFDPQAVNAFLSVLETK
ncbi:MAG: hypothetical protein AUJ75_04765 [Candidatus Omnitrophica bacterium CG1_02_49_10]|nr:MAG: hypothetical protein AUJ75_04765 [Candidatus Omnitrophica bacterium CG1_02_49_10]